jgi:glutamyl-tRNA synthetase
MDLTTHIRAYAAKNALEFGKADAGRILPKLFQHGLDRKDIGKIMPEIQQIVSDINALPKDEIEEIAQELHEFVKERQEKEKTLPELPNAVQGKVVTRLPPEPSKYLHAGHAISFLFNYVYAKRYGGKCILRFDDANPEKVTQEYVDSTLDDLDNYLEIKYDGVKFVSDDMPIFYKYAEQLINQGNAYMCFCDRDTMQNLRHSGKPCPCRNSSKDASLKAWKSALKGVYKEGETTLRFKGNMEDLNHIMRDPVMFRIVKARHFRQKDKYKIWPNYDFYSPIEDSLLGMTHILRSNEFDQRVPFQNMLLDALGLKHDYTVVQYGRYGIIDATTKGREIREGIKAGEYIGWDDPRLVTLKALKRRGIKKEVFYLLIEQLGLAKKEANIDFDMIAAISRKLIDAETERYYFVEDPVELEIKNAPAIKEVEISIHPDKPKETRKVRVTPGLISISKKDFKENKGKEVRLLHLYNTELGKTKNGKYTSTENKAIPRITWVPTTFAVKVKVLMPDATWVEGLAEENVEALKEGDVVQFERFGFVKLDKKTKKVLEFWFTHN